MTNVRPPADPTWIDRGGKVRFLGLSADGRTSSSWSVWTSRNHKDVYLAPRQLAGQVKVSLHQSGSFSTSFVSEQKAARWLGVGAERHLDIWDRPPEFEPGWTRFFEVILSRWGPAMPCTSTYSTPTFAPAAST
jgi:hypothetical protein